MAGHSHAHNVKHKKDAVDQKRAKMFTKMARDLSIAAKHGGINPDFNPRLKTCLEYAQYINFPKENIKRALEKSQNTDNHEYLRYECFAGSISFIILAYSDNRNRIASQIRAVIKHINGDFGKCLYLFQHLNKCTYNKSKSDQILCCDIEHIEEADDFLYVYCKPEVIKALEKECGEALSIDEIYKAYNNISVAKNHDIYKILAELDEIDDVTEIFCNIE